MILTSLFAMKIAFKTNKLNMNISIRLNLLVFYYFKICNKYIFSLSKIIFYIIYFIIKNYNKIA